MLQIFVTVAVIVNAVTVTNLHFRYFMMKTLKLKAALQKKPVVNVQLVVQSLVYVPVLQQVLGVLDLVLSSCDGDDAVLRAL